jgi:hypothetical protein
MARRAARRLCQAQGVGTYWVVDTDAGAVEVWAPEVAFPIIERERVTWRPPGAGEPLVIELADLFRGG